MLDNVRFKNSSISQNKTTKLQSLLVILNLLMIRIQYFFQPDEDILFFNDRYIKGELQVMFDEINVDIDISEVLKCCKQLNSGKTCGPDMMLNDFLYMVLKIDMF